MADQVPGAIDTSRPHSARIGNYLLGGTDNHPADRAAAEAIVLRRPDQVLTREQLLSRVWGFDYDPGSNVVDVYVRYLRRKLGADLVQTIRGVGYRLRATAPTPPARLNSRS
ncbi:winged helix-turn-helix domain-containing protein [Streptomyces sp. MAR4 CNY-716]